MFFFLIREALEQPKGQRRIWLQEQCPEFDIDPDTVISALAEADRSDFLQQQDPTGTLPSVDGYLIEAVIGEGGMGKVYRAVHSASGREVALKFSHSLLPIGEARTRFLLEREALARLNHPGIAQLHDAGTTSDGRPFFAMELVDGVPVTEYCQQQSATIQDRLTLFLQLCSAVQHAHLRQVLHRDLKPQNVLVTSTADGAAVSKVIDFGIAKALDATGYNVTMTGDRVLGTPAYLSPEALSGDFEIRSDVYGLGCILFEMLCGRPPLQRRGEPMSAFIARIQREATVAPSTVVNDADERLQLRGDIDAIVLKCLAKDPSDRYDSATELAADVTRFLENRPIHARTSSATEKVWRWVRRNRLLTASLSLSLLSVVAGIIGISVALIEARDQARQAQQAATEAEQVSQFLIDLFEVSDPGNARGSDVTARQLLDHAAQQAPERFTDHPQAQARFLVTIADIYSKLGLYSEALPLVEQAIQHYARLQEDDDQLHQQYGEALYALAILHLKTGELEEARQHMLQALRFRESSSKISQHDLAMTLNGLATIELRLVETDRAKELFERASAIWERLGNDEYLARPLDGLASIHMRNKNYTAAAINYQAALDARIQSLGPGHPHVAASFNNMCLVLPFLGQLNEAQTACHRAIDIYQATLGAEHEDVARSMAILARVHREMGETDLALDLLDKAAAMTEAKLGPEHRLVGTWRETLGNDLWRLGLYDRAEQAFEKALISRRATFGESHMRTQGTLAALGAVYWKRGELDRAEATLLATLPFLDEYPIRAATAHDYLSGVYFDRMAPGDRDKAIRHGELAYTTFQALESPEDQSRADQLRHRLEALGVKTDGR